MRVKKSNPPLAAKIVLIWDVPLIFSVSQPPPVSLVRGQRRHEKTNLYFFSLIQSEPYLPGPLDFAWESVVGLVPWEMLSRIPVSAWIFFILK